MRTVFILDGKQIGVFYGFGDGRNKGNLSNVQTNDNNFARLQYTDGKEIILSNCVRRISSSGKTQFIDMESKSRTL